MKDLKLIESVDLLTYVQAVNDIVEKYFDEDGNYTPHLGRANSVGVLFNYFVDEESMNAKFPESDEQLDVQLLLQDAECMALYEKATLGKGRYDLDFANAMSDALDIINTRKTSLRYSFEILLNALSDMLDKFSSTLDESNVAKISEIVNKISQGNIGEKIMDKYEKSGRIEKIAK